MPASVADRLRQVEIELAEKKLALTQALCENQELVHQLRRSTSIASDSDTTSINSMRSINNNNNNPTVSWLSKTVNTIKEAASSTNRTKVN
jgi:CII-binding regulator of phage lambda lysogenization HflD